MFARWDQCGRRGYHFFFRASARIDVAAFAPDRDIAAFKGHDAGLIHIDISIGKDIYRPASGREYACFLYFRCVAEKGAFPNVQFACGYDVNIILSGSSADLGGGHFDVAAAGGCGW